MTRERALEILNEASGRFAGVSRQSMPISEWYDNYVGPLEESLFETEPFSPLKYAWLFAPDGGGRILQGMLSSWVLDRFEDGLAAQEIVDKIGVEIAENVSRLFEVTAIFGADLDRALNLNEQATIIPANEIDKKWRRLNVQKSLNNSPFEFLDCCVLAHRLTLKPAMRPRESLEQEVNADAAQTSPSVEERDRVRELVRLAFLLSGSTAIELPARTLVPDGDRLLAASGIRYGSVAHGMLPHTTQFKADEVERKFVALSQFGERESLFRAIDRLGRSRSDVLAADKALDLGIAAEILLMHGANSENTEVTHKLAIRSAWLLGNDVERRLEISQTAKSLYSARSKVAHSGKLAKPVSFNAEASDKFVKALASAVLEKGGFPNWDNLCLGG